ncbi:MAG TPA: MBL fold metallo-hydrolase [Candidatus Eisenbacteria bacterium]|nr:MBL fold metallo-hydrolase [Candidatus Eisenbacteria bacterium]
MRMNLEAGPTRREFLRSAGLAATALALPYGVRGDDDVSIPGLVQKARDTAASDQVTAQKLRGGVHVLMGAGGNIAVLPGHDGKLLVDAGFAGARPQISKALAGISADPIQQLINSHWHFDHTDGNAWLHSEGAKILAHVNTKKHLSTDTLVQGWAFTFAASPAGAIPSEVFTGEKNLEWNGMKLELKAYEPAHTDSDISILFTNADVWHVADTFWNGYYPFIDYSTGGSIDGMIRATEANLKRATDKLIIVPGHGAIANKQDLAVYHELLSSSREKIAAMKKQGKTLNEVVAAKPTAAYDAKWGGGFMSPKMFTGLVYEGV